MADRTWDEIKDYMASIDGVYCMARGGSVQWYIQSEESAHIQKLIQKQKRHVERSPSPKKFVAKKFLNKSTEPKECFFKDNYAYKYKRWVKWTSTWLSNDERKNLILQLSNKKFEWQFGSSEWHGLQPYTIAGRWLFHVDTDHWTEFSADTE